MINVNAGVDYCHNSGAGDSKAFVGVGQPNDLPCWLSSVAVGRYTSEITHWGGVGQSVRGVIDGGQRNRERAIRLNALNSEQRFEQVYHAADQCLQYVAGGRYQVGLSNWAVERALHLAVS